MGGKKKEETERGLKDTQTLGSALRGRGTIQPFRGEGHRGRSLGSSPSRLKKLLKLLSTVKLFPSHHSLENLHLPFSPCLILLPDPSKPSDGAAQPYAGRERPVACSHFSPHRKNPAWALFFLPQAHLTPQHPQDNSTQHPHNPKDPTHRTPPTARNQPPRLSG